MSYQGYFLCSVEQITIYILKTLHLSNNLQVRHIHVFLLCLIMSFLYFKMAAMWQVERLQRSFLASQDTNTSQDQNLPLKIKLIMISHTQWHCHAFNVFICLSWVNHKFVQTGKRRIHARLTRVSYWMRNAAGHISCLMAPEAKHPFIISLRQVPWT